ncbi:hypothetical protein ACPPVU_07380 [Mucilaginibacter sp. McL0603]|uniref:hypothetical protein n=1 Tax=Mucilaginibacter sp. McL0603 TaxID=3415670 RepID=UPI003CEA169E
MKMKFKLSKNLGWMLSVLMAFGLASCKKDNSTGFTPGTGAPVITSINKISNSVVDSSRTSSVTTYDASGNPTTVTSPNYNPQMVGLDSATVTGTLGGYYVIKGSNLGTTSKIVINGVLVYFNRGLSSDNSVVFTIPTTIPYVQPQANTIVVTTLHGTVTYKFTTLPPPPTIVSETTNNFQAGSTITLTGKGFASVSSVKLKSTGDVVTIVSQNDSTLVVKMPQSTATQTNLLFTYTSGTNTGAQTISANVFNDLDNAAYQVFIDKYGTGVYANSWGPSGISTTVAKTGTSSFYITYPKGNYWIGGWGFNTPLANNYKSLTFWVKGGVQDEILDFISASGNGGYNNTDQTFTITVPANVWTYFQIDVSKTDMFLTAQTTSDFGFYIRGPNGTDETLYFDDVVFWK